MKSRWIKKILKYDGTQLHSHFAYENFGLTGSSVLAFRGPVDVALTEMVDIEDVRHKEAIAADEMLSFIVEAFDTDLRGAIWMQRLLMAIMQNELNYRMQQIVVSRVGDDLIFDGRKLSVSIATVSPVSAMIHSAINIKPGGAPLPIACLEEMEVEPEDFARTVMRKFSAEFDEVEFARVKVRWVK